MLTECHCGCHNGGLMHFVACCTTCPGCNGRFKDNPAFRMHARICPHKPEELMAEYKKSLASLKATAPTAMLLGRFQPFHDGHLELARQAIERVGQVCIAMRYTEVDAKNPFDAHQRAIFIMAKMRPHVGKYIIELVPNFTHVFYGRDVGYSIEQLDTGVLKQVSATQIREDLL